MAEREQLFSILQETVAPGEFQGAAITKSEAGDAAAGKVGPTVFGFKDSDGNLVLPQLDAEGRLAVTSQGQGTQLRNKGSNASGTASEVDLVTLTLAASKTYVNILAQGSCFHETLFRLVKSDNAVETELGAFRVGPGSYSIKHTEEQMATGATGVQTLILKAINPFNGKISRIDGKLEAVLQAVGTP